MKKKTRKVFTTILVAFVLLFTVLALSLNTLIDKNRKVIRDEVEKALGRSVAFDNLRLDLWGGLGLSAKNLRVADDPRFAATPLIQTRELRMQVRWLPLLKGIIEIKKFALDQPEVQIIKNESGDFNLLRLAASKRKAGAEKKAERPRKRSPLAFLLSVVQVSQGKIHYVDRSSKEPVEIRLHDLDLNVSLGPTGAAGVSLATSLLDGQRQNVSLKGQVGPLSSMAELSRAPLDLRMEVDSVPFPQLTQAVPFLKKMIPAYLGITGPLSLQAKLTGTLERPRITGMTLTAALFGAVSNNVEVTADLDLTDGDPWTTAGIRGELVAEPVTLDNLKKIPFVERFLPPSVSAQGPLSLTSRVEGKIQDLKVQATINADKSAIRYGRWFEKPEGVPARIELSAAQSKESLVLGKSTLSLHNLHLDFSGSLEEKPERLLTLRVRTDALELSGWDKMLLPISSYDIAGKLGFDLAIRRVFAPRGDNMDVRGILTVDALRATDKKNGRSVDGITSKITFQGKEARVEKLALRLGSSSLSVKGTVRNLRHPTMRYTLRAPKLTLADLTNLPEHKSDWIKDFSSSGVFTLNNGNPSIHARVSSGEGIQQKIAYESLQAEFAWRPDSLSLKNLAIRTLGGSFKGNGLWEMENGKNPRFTFSPAIEEMNLKELFSHFSPENSDRVEGLLNLQGKVTGWGKDWATIRRTMRGEGNAVVHKGALKDFNLVEGVLSRVTGLPGISNLISERVSPRYAEIFKRADTPFDRLETSFRIGDERLVASKVRLASPEYTIQGDGYVGFDQDMKWKATLAMSPRFTEELMERNGNVRYLVDDQKRLGVPFELEGRPPDVKPKPDTKRLSQLIQRGLIEQGAKRALDGKKQKGNGRDWIRKGLEQLLGK